MKLSKKIKFLIVILSILLSFTAISSSKIVINQNDNEDFIPPTPKEPWIKNGDIDAKVEFGKTYIFVTETIVPDNYPDNCLITYHWDWNADRIADTTSQPTDPHSKVRTNHIFKKGSEPIEVTFISVRAENSYGISEWTEPVTLIIPKIKNSNFLSNILFENSFIVRILSKII